MLDDCRRDDTLKDLEAERLRQIDRREGQRLLPGARDLDRVTQAAEEVT